MILEVLASLLLMLSGIYLVAGLLFSIFFVSTLIERVDERAVNTGLWFRLIIFPGCVVLWPVLLRMWLKEKRKKRPSVIE